MKRFYDLVQRRRSHRKFTETTVSDGDVRCVLRAALMSPSSKSRRSWQFVVVRNAVTIRSLALAKTSGSDFLRDAPIAIVVVGDVSGNDCWVEDCSIAAVAMQYQAEELGLGSCWVQLHGRGLDDGTTSDTVVRNLLGIPEGWEVLCVIALGHPADERKPQSEERLKWGNVHEERW
ncbi:MAG: nitroreductase family protein [Prevotella sp.]|nr:nitroreductase family protein [Prevotella sp.]